MEDAVTQLQRLWLTEAIHWRETHAGPLDDAEAVRRARQQGGSLETRLQHRAMQLAERDGLSSALRRWRQGSSLALLLLALLALLSGAGMAAAALGDGTRPVNVFWAVGSLLGLNLLMLALWLGALLTGQRQAGTLGRAWLWLSEKCARDAQAAHLIPSLLLLLQRRNLTRWLLGAAANGLWLLCATSALVTLALMLATRRYGFVWETTLLGSDMFVNLTQALGTLPAALGFSVPGAEAIRASGQSAVAGAGQPWATWLLGVLLCYGVLPRALLALLCWSLWRRGKRHLTVDIYNPLAQALAERLMPTSETLGVNDPAPAPAAPAAYAQPRAIGNGAVAVAIELDGDHPWPPPLPGDAENAGILDDRASRKRLLDQFTQDPPRRLLMACDPRRSPDRGTLALLGELARSATQARVWLMPAPAGQALNAERLADWQTALAQAGLEQATAQWLEADHG